jgi:hypothetical protein
MADGSRFRKARRKAGPVEDSTVIQAREVFELAAKSIAERFSIDVDEARRALEIRCGEQDPKVTGSNEAVSKTVQSTVDDALLSLGVEFQFDEESTCERVILLSLMENRRKINQSLRSKALWDDLPADVREERILNNRPKVSYRIFPTEA